MRCILSNAELMVIVQDQLNQEFHSDGTSRRRAQQYEQPREIENYLITNEAAYIAAISPNAQAKLDLGPGGYTVSHSV